MKKGYEGYFLNQAFVPSVLLPYKEKLRMTHLFEQLTRTNADIKMGLISNQGIDPNKHGVPNFLS